MGAYCRVLNQVTAVQRLQRRRWPGIAPGVPAQLGHGGRGLLRQYGLLLGGCGGHRRHWHRHNQRQGRPFDVATAGRDRTARLMCACVRPMRLATERCLWLSNLAAIIAGRRTGRHSPTASPRKGGLGHGCHQGGGQNSDDPQITHTKDYTHNCLPRKIGAVGSSLGNLQAGAGFALLGGHAL